MEEKVSRETPEMDYQQENVKLNYENNVLKSRLKDAYKTIDMLSDQRGIERIKFLFKVVENRSNNFSAEFIAKAVEEIEETMYPREKETKDE